MTILTRGHFMFVIEDGACITTDLYMLGGDDRDALKRAVEVAGDYDE